MLLQSTPFILFPGIELPPRAMLGVQESMDFLGDVETERNIHGALIILTPPWMREGDELITVELSTSVDRSHTLAIDDLPIGKEVVFYSGHWWVAAIQPGQTTCRLRRPPVPGSVTGLNARLKDSPRIDVTVGEDPRDCSIPGILGYPVNVYYRPAPTMQVTARSPGSIARFGTARSSTLSLQEKEPVA